VRRTLIVLALAVGSGALAAPAAQPDRLAWADFVGDWAGKLEWGSCTFDGAKEGTFSVDATDGALSIDLGPAGSAFGTMSLVEDGAGFTGQQADVKVKLTRTAKELELAVDLDSGCTVRATLSRPSVGIAACDRLAAWSRIEQQCSKLAHPPLENPARLARQRAEWTKARGDARDKLAAQCTKRSARVETRLVDVGCAPNADPKIGMRGAECQALRGVSARVQRCAAIPFDIRTDLERNVVVLLAAAQGADQASLPVVDGQCKATREKLAAMALQAGCPP
jgi:hypothetical protein